MGAAIRRDVINSLHSLANPFKATEALISVGKQDNNFRGNKQGPWRNTVGDFLRTPSSNCPHFYSHPLPRARSVSSLPQHSDHNGTIAKHFEKVQWVHIQPVGEWTENTVHLVSVNQGWPTHQVTATVLKGSVPLNVFPACSGRPWHLTDLVPGEGTINVFKWSLHIDIATIQKDF